MWLLLKKLSLLEAEIPPEELRKNLALFDKSHKDYVYEERRYLSLNNEPKIVFFFYVVLFLVPCCLLRKKRMKRHFMFFCLFIVIHLFFKENENHEKQFM